MSFWLSIGVSLAGLVVLFLLAFAAGHMRGYRRGLDDAAGRR